MTTYTKFDLGVVDELTFLGITFDFEEFNRKNLQKMFNNSHQAFPAIDISDG